MANRRAVSALRAADQHNTEAGFRRKLLILTVLVIVVLAVGGARYIGSRQADLRTAAHEQLSAIADLKLRQISTWREERLDDARFFSRARFAARDVRRFLEKPDSDSRRSEVLHWLSLLKGADRYYAAMIYDTQLQCRLAIPDQAGESIELLRTLRDEALQTDNVILSDLHRDQPGGPIGLDVFFPIFEEADLKRAAPIAFVLLQLDSRKFLFPLVQSWPTPSPTAETLLVRREGNDALYLNDLRFKTGAALSLRLPLNSPDLPAGRALRGETRPLQGLDYRGEPVVAVGRMIPGTSWAMVAKVSRHELYAPLRRELLTELSVLGGLLLISVLTVGLVWRQRTSQFLQRELALEIERSALANRLADLMRNANDIILILDQDGRVMEANECALKSYGYRLSEIQQRNLRDLCAPDGLAVSESNWNVLESRGATVFETEHRRSNGSTFPVEVSSRKIGDGGDNLILSIVRDVSERKRAETQIQALNLALRQRNAELESRVVERTAVLTQTVQSLEAETQERARAQDALYRANQRLNALALELTRAEAQERNRISQILHDHLQQLVVAARLNLDFVGARLTDSELRQAVASASDALNEAMSECRSLTFELAPPLLMGGLAAALSWLAELMKSRYGLTVRMQLSPGTGPEDPGVVSLLFQSVREALFNVVKHAGVREAALTVTQPEPHTLRIEVTDRGAGFDPAKQEARAAQAGQSGFGLFSIRNRLQSLGGQMEVQGAPGEGTHVILTLPLSAPPASPR